MPIISADVVVLVNARGSISQKFDNGTARRVQLSSKGRDKSTCGVPGAGVGLPNGERITSDAVSAES